ncbi:mechanosensitive ion channel family protein [Lentibacillus lipolyticus]|nr:mechanosensitive ion channel family protein [Lentibacillus lipolyticus]
MTWDWNKFVQYDALENIAIAIGVFLLFLLFRKIFTKYIFALLMRLGKKAPGGVFPYILSAFEKPVRWVFIIIGVYTSVRYFPYLSETNPLFLDIIRSSIVFIVGWGLFNLSSSSSQFFFKVEERFNIDIDDLLIPFLSKALRFIIVAISISIIAQEFDYNVGGFVAGLGLGGLAFALAAKDAIGNLFGGIVIITEKPFTIGDWIKTDSVEGTVEDITFRSTRVRTFADALVTVPNATLANESIINWSEMGKRQITFDLRLTYDTPRDKVKRVVEQIDLLLKNHSGVDQETIFVKFNEYRENGLNVFLYFFTKTTAWEEYLKIREEINLNIMEVLENEGVSIALPARRLYMEQQEDGHGGEAGSPVRQEP